MALFASQVAAGERALLVTASAPDGAGAWIASCVAAGAAVSVVGVGAGGERTLGAYASAVLRLSAVARAVRVPSVAARGADFDAVFVDIVACVGARARALAGWAAVTRAAAGWQRRGRARTTACYAMRSRRRARAAGSLSGTRSLMPRRCVRVLSLWGGVRLGGGGAAAAAAAAGTRGN